MSLESTYRTFHCIMYPDTIFIISPKFFDIQNEVHNTEKISHHGPPSAFVFVHSIHFSKWKAETVSSDTTKLPSTMNSNVHLESANHQIHWEDLEGRKQERDGDWETERRNSYVPKIKKNLIISVRLMLNGTRRWSPKNKAKELGQASLSSQFLNISTSASSSICMY